MDRAEAKQCAQLHAPDFLKRARNISGKHSYVCPCCNNGTGKDKTGITQVPHTSSHPKYHCFNCGFTGDVFDLAKEFTGYQSPTQIFEYVYRAFGILTDSGELVRSPDLPQQEAPEEVEESFDYVNQIEYFRECSSRLDPTYLESRGISSQTQKHFMIGTDPNWINPRAIERFKANNWDLKFLKPSPRCIIPTDTYSYLARDTREESALSEKEQKMMKQKYGKTPLFNEKFGKRGDVVFVTEGEIDCISVYEVSKLDGVGLGSTSNWRHLASKAKEDQPFHGKVFVLLLDNDNPGQKAQRILKNALEQYGNTVITPSLGEYKDPNEFLQKDYRGFQKLVADTYEQAKEFVKGMEDPESEMEM